MIEFVFDIKTVKDPSTGQDRIFEVAVVEILHGKITGRSFYRKVKPSFEISNDDIENLGLERGKELDGCVDENVCYGVYDFLNHKEPGVSLYRRSIDRVVFLESKKAMDVFDFEVNIMLCELSLFHRNIQIVDLQSLAEELGSENDSTSDRLRKKYSKGVVGTYEHIDGALIATYLLSQSYLEMRDLLYKKDALVFCRLVEKSSGLKGIEFSSEEFLEGYSDCFVLKLPCLINSYNNFVLPSEGTFSFEVSVDAVSSMLDDKKIAIYFYFSEYEEYAKFISYLDILINNKYVAFLESDNLSFPDDCVRVYTPKLSHINVRYDQCL